MKAIEVENLSFRYKDYGAALPGCQQEPGRPLFDGLSLSLRQGEHRLVAGPPGAGKTTLCRILIGAAPKYFPGCVSGKARVLGKDLAAVQTWDLLRDIAYVPQNSEELLLTSTVEDEIAFPLQMTGVPRGRMAGLVRSQLEKFSLEPFGSRSLESLSGGEKKRLLLAVADVIDPSILLLDESFDELDGNFKAALAAWLKGTAKTVLAFCSRPIEIYKGLFDSFSILENGALRPSTEDEIFRLGQGADLPPLGALPPSEGWERKNRISVSETLISKGETFRLRVPCFELGEGEVVALTGPNGSGKSSFARVLCGLDDAAKGRISLQKPERLLNIGYLFQNPDYQIFLPTVRDELGYPSPEGKDIEGACRLFGLKPDSTASLLGFPERKRLQAAVYHLLRRRFYVIDEIESALDYKSCRLIISILRSGGAGILLITHDPVLAGWAGRSYFISNGVMRPAKTPSEGRG